MPTQNNYTPHLPTDYDAQVRRTIPYYDSMHTETIDLVRSLKEEPDVWLDTGCGTGTMIWNALRYFPNTRFMLADPSETMLDQARMKFVNVERVRFIGPVSTQGLITEIDERPDVITAVQCHHYLSRDQRERAVKVCFDLLNSDGAFVTFENVRPLTAYGIEIGKKSLGRFQLENGRAPAEIEQQLARFDRDYFPITIEEHLSLLRRTGFKVVEPFWYSYLQAGFYCIK
ncbi:MAG: class I SAM-dependent methyltransferase [Methanomassiliicoccales archaeon]|nr:class I SAM-dependent methyltransferase [Methanomassiliicoccales archaeon]